MLQCCAHILSAFNIQISVWTHLWIKRVFGVLSLESDQLYAFVEILTMQEGAFWSYLVTIKDCYYIMCPDS